MGTQDERVAVIMYVLTVTRHRLLPDPTLSIPTCGVGRTLNTYRTYRLCEFHAVERHLPNVSVGGRPEARRRRVGLSADVQRSTSNNVSTLISVAVADIASSVFLAHLCPSERSPRNYKRHPTVTDRQHCAQSSSNF